jgi:hypothetical protein
MSLSEFGAYYDGITEKQVLDYKKEIEAARKERVSNKNTSNRKGNTKK